MQGEKKKNMDDNWERNDPPCAFRRLPWSKKMQGDSELEWGQKPELLTISLELWKLVRLVWM